MLLVLGLYAWRYYLERTACFDSAFFSWLMIDTGEPVSALGRYGSWIAQLLPLVLLKAGAPLQDVLRAYSMAFVLFHALVFYMLVFRLRDLRATVALPLFLTGAFHYMFYYGISELYQGLSLSLVLWVLIRRAWAANTTPWWSIAAVLLNIWVSFYHQLLVLPLLFLLVHEALEGGLWRQRKTWLLPAVMLLWYVLRIMWMTSSSYEEARMPRLADLITYTRRLGELNSTAYLIMVWTKFKALLLIIGMSGLLAMWQRAWARLLWAITFTAAFVVLILVVDRDGMAPVIYENYYPVVGLVWAVMFATHVMALGAARIRLGHAAMGLSCALGLLQIHRGHYRLTDRVEYVRRLTDHRLEQGVRKSLVRFDNYPWAYGLVHWAVGMESALCSGVRGPHEASTIFVSDKTAFLDSVRAATDVFLGPDWQPLWFGLRNLDHRYFDLPVDVGYAWANSVDSLWPPTRWTMRGPEAPYRFVPDRFTVVPVTIENQGPFVLSSCGPGGRPLQFVYHLLRPDGTLYQESAIRSSLETDVAPDAIYHQGLVVERPVDNGRYVVLAWLERDGVKVGPDVRFEMTADAWPL